MEGIVQKVWRKIKIYIKLAWQDVLKDIKEGHSSYVEGVRWMHNFFGKSNQLYFITEERVEIALLLLN